MDAYVEMKLREWNLEEFLQNFESESIDEESFKLLLEDNETMKILIPKGGPRLKFKKYLKQILFPELSDNFNAQNISPENVIISCDLSVQDYSTTLPLSDSSTSTSTQSQSFASLDTPPELSPVGNSTPLHNASTSDEVARDTNTLTELQSTKKLDLRVLLKRKLPEILKKIDTGISSDISILDKHKINRLIVDTYIEKYGCKATTKEKLDLARDIVMTFPILRSTEGEGFEQWFCPGVKGTLSSGFIAGRFRNYRLRNLSSTERIELGIGAGRLLKQSREKQMPVCGVEDKSIEFLQKQQWLKENNQPLEKVLQLMQETFQGRRYQIMNGLTEDIIKLWPRILDSNVIDGEFTQLYGEKKCDVLCLEFGLISRQILLQAKNCGRKAAEEIANSVEFDIHDSNTSFEVINCAIQLLPFLLPQGIFSKQDGNKRIKVRPTANQSMAHFIQFIQFIQFTLSRSAQKLYKTYSIGEGIDKFVKEDRLLGGERKQPFVLAVGEKLSPIQTFVVVEDNIIPAQSMLKAIDICFKICFVLNLEFSPYCKNVWNFLNDVFYKCDINAETASCISELKNRLFVVTK